MSEKRKMFLILTGAVTAFGLPFALAFPPTFLEKALAMGALVIVAAAVAAAIQALKKDQAPK